MNRKASVFAPAVSCLAFLIFGASGWAQDAAPAKLNIVIVEGDGAINNVKQRVNREPIVQVEDENHKPIAGAVVVFFLPDQGPTGTFANGARSLTVTTNAQGRATLSAIHFNSASGPMQIRVTASYQGQTATSVINQTNLAGGGGGGGGGLSAGAKVLIIIGIAAGAGAGAFVALHGGGSSSNSGGPGSISITPGSPTVGAPR